MPCRIKKYQFQNFSFMWRHCHTNTSTVVSLITGKVGILYCTRWESGFTLGLNTAKCTDYIEKCFKQNLRRSKFSIKNLVEAYLGLPEEWSYGTPKIVPFLKYYNTLEWEIKYTLQLNTAKNIGYIEKCFK